MPYHAIATILTGLVVAQIATFGTTLYLHRCQTHSAFQLHPAMHWLFRLLLWLTTGQRTREWVAVHRQHHAHSDEPGDPHSPELEGFWRVQILNFWLYIKASKNRENIAKYGRDIQETAWDRLVFNRGLLGLATGINVLGLTLGFWWGLLAAAVHTISYVGVLTACVNALGHHRIPTGYQNYGQDCGAEKTFNYRWLAYLTGGEGLHNNHHGDPGSAWLAHKANEHDPGRWLLGLLVRFNLAWDVKLPRALQTR